MSAPVYRTLTCQQCGNEFQRLAQRGQPPKRCPDCRPTQARRIAIGTGACTCGVDAVSWQVDKTGCPLHAEAAQ